MLVVASTSKQGVYLSKEMKSILALFLLFSLLLVGKMSYARKDVGDYWKNVMNDQPMPDAIKNLIQVPHASLSSDKAGKAHFSKDFDVEPNIILYHTHVKDKQKGNYEPVSGKRKSSFEHAA